MSSNKKVYTYLEAKNEIVSEMDLEDLDDPENFIDDDELRNYFNKGIDEAEAEILTTSQWYFKRTDTMNLLLHGSIVSVVASNSGGFILFTATSHGLGIDSRVTFAATALPGNISASTDYWVVSVPTANTYTVSLTRRGTAVAFTSAGTAVTAIYEGQRYAMPIDIYANKLLWIQYSNGSIRYKVHRVKDEDIVYLDNAVTTSLEYYYDIENDDPTVGAELILHGPSRETSTNITRRYIRNANRLESDTDKIDIPEFNSFVFAYVRWRVSLKDLRPTLSVDREELERQRLLMKQTLDDMIPDEDETIEPDMSFYEEFDTHHGGGHGMG